MLPQNIDWGLFSGVIKSIPLNGFPPSPRVIARRLGMKNNVNAEKYMRTNTPKHGGFHYDIRIQSRSFHKD